MNSKAMQLINLFNAALGKSKTGVTFLSIRNYKNKNGEQANHLINIGIKYTSAKAKDINFLTDLNVKDAAHGFKGNVTTLEEARVALLASMIKPSENRSNGQIDAYTTIVEGIKVHNESGQLYIYGYRENKTVIKEGTYKHVNSCDLTLAKKEIQKKLRTGKFTQYALTVGNDIKAKGDTIEL